jgi:DNA repair protein RadC
MYEVTAGFGKVLVESDEIISVEKYAKGGSIKNMPKVRLQNQMCRDGFTLTGDYYIMSETKDFKGNTFYVVLDPESKRRHECYIPDSIIFKSKNSFGEGGSIEMQNYEMVKNNNKAIAHHSKELDSVLIKNKKVPAWVVAKVYEASTDLSDVTHYLDGAKFEDGGKIQEYNGTKYLSWDFENKGNKWNITVFWGKFNYISVLKKTNNPFGGRMGKDFKSMDEAIANYKDPSIQANIIFAVDEAKKNGMPDQFAKGGYVRPSFDIKTSGIYKFKTPEKEYTIQSYMFERKDHDSDSLEIQDELRGELGSIVIQNSAWKNLSSGKSINAVSETGKKGKLTRIDDTKNVSKYFEEGGVSDNDKVVKVGDVWKVKKSANEFWQKLTSGNIYQDLTFPTKEEAEAWLSKKPTFAKGGGVQYKDLSTQKDPVINDSKNKFSEKKNDVPEVDIVFKKAVEFDSYPKITNADTAAQVFRKFWDSKRINIQEAFYVMHLNNANNVISVYAPFKGGITSTVADIELICATAIKSLAKAVIICHNHPSGQLKFSEADINLTKNLSTALKIVNIDLLDSMVLTETDYISMADQGINFAPKQI